MRILLLAGANSIHTVRWANGLSQCGVDVHVVSVHAALSQFNSSISLHILSNRTPFGYISSVFEVRKLISEIQPDLINAHYATGYGLLMRLVNFKPSLLSVWGSDIYDFPEKSFFHRIFLRNNLKAATAIASTSRCMASKTSEIFQHKSLFITPFGVDELTFRPYLPTYKNNEVIVIGTVKTMKPIYGIDILIKAFAKAWKVLKEPNNIKLVIAGDGPELPVLKNLAAELGVINQVVFHGHVEHSDVPELINQLDVFCAFSRFESFGVAILEASACQKPVIVSDADGPSEVVINECTGIIVPKEDINASANAMVRLIQCENLRKQMGINGRQHVIENYTWEMSLDLMIKVYEDVISLS
jgi:glycosyltransferase involved in cell wall biosynthesis